MVEEMEIVPAEIKDHEALTVLTKQSKAYWGYSSQQIEAWRDELKVSEEYIQNCTVFKLLINQELVAYYAYKNKDVKTILLDNIFVHPNHIGKGYGKLLMNDFIEKVKATKKDYIVLYSEPKAEAFYQQFGFKTFDQLASSIPGRFLPIMKKEMRKKKAI